MPVFDRSASTEVKIIDQWEEGFGWIAHPEEDGKRTSHAIRGDDGVWVFDPLDAPEIYQKISDLGTVKGVVLLSSFHGRNASQFANHFEVPVYLPTWMERPTDELTAPMERYEAPPDEWTELAESDILLRTVDSPVVWREVVAYHRSEKTLRVPDLLSPVPEFRVGDERVGCYLLHRIAPPRQFFADIEPDRILFGHGEGISEDAESVLDTTLANARRYLPRALVFQLPHQVLAIGSAVYDEFGS
jgi:hypothetical protein